MNKNVKEGTRPQGGVGAIAILLMLFGGTTIAMNFIAFALSLHDLKWLHVALGVLCGTASLATGIMIWRNAPSACRGYIILCITMIAYWISLASPFTPYTMLGYAFALFILFAGYRYISRNRRVT
jgi:hypothetical protein